MKTESKEILETEVVEEEDFLANVCPLNPDNLEECTACQQKLTRAPLGAFANSYRGQIAPYNKGE